ncbi:hypothetical protein [Nocardioides litoris]|uniref:hypothetical protein n=1 Tax=Nocardioides litoris TaxID=1926648 RepID=UPI00111D7ACA|nr:hypothetical protein [Nocardioides litoris]
MLAATGRPAGVVRLVERGRVLAAGRLDARGRASLRVPARRLGLGRAVLVVRYAGSATHRPDQDTLRVRVRRG